ncbi:MAG: NACHT domain-containing protein, partial [Candidatus Altarchaeaceae archaeon]
ILGDPGTGKTTILRYIALIFSRGLKKVYEKFNIDEWLLPVLVPFSGIYPTIKDKSFVDAICDYYKRSVGLENTRFIKEYLKEGKCIVLLDGLDEIPEEKERFNISREVENFIRMYGKNRFIITSRILGYEKINIEGIKEYYVSQLNDEEIEKFVNSWFLAFEKKIKEGSPENVIKNIAENEAKQLIESINSDKNIKELSRNPFLLSLICLVQKSGYKLPRYRVDLY